MKWKVQKPKPAADLPMSFAKFCKGLHQDIGLFAKGTDQIISFCLGQLTEGEKLELKIFLERALRKHSSAELKGFLNRSTIDVGFSAKGAHHFLESTLRRLSNLPG